MGSIRKARELADIAPQYIAKSGLCSASEVDSTKWGSIRIQHVTGLGSVSEGKSRFPKLDECAHFHYEHVEIGPLQVSIADDENLKPLSYESEEEKWWSLNIESQGKTWLIRRSYDNFRMLDQQLHRCIYDRKFSELTELPEESIEDKENIHKLLSDYVKRFSAIAGNLINCGPILNWLELDNRGHRLLVPDNDNCPINTPAVAAAYSVKRYAAQAPDEISFEVGDMISVIDMPPPEESIWWHGKKGFQVGFFPCECVAVIGDKVPRNLQLSSLSSQPMKPVLRKHGKLIAFFRSFILSRPSRRRLKQSGILRERVFGCDLGEHLLNSGHEIPMVLKCCVEFIETNGLVDGIYRLSGVTSNIQKLRNAFDEDRVPTLYEDEAILQDVHSVASLLKMYFRELPNPLCTYQLYHQFVAAVQATQGDDTRLLKMRDVVQKLPPPHYRTLEYLMRHLARVSEKGHETGMTSRNIAIVWAPNLLRCKELEVGGVAALQGVGVQAVVTEFLICYAELIFCDRLPNFSLPTQQVSTKKCRPKSLAISTPTKLLSLEEARNRALLQASGKTEQGYIEVGGGPANLPAKYHTVIELPGYSRKRMGSKRSPLGWKLLFGKSGRNSQRKDVEIKPATTSEISIIPSKALTETDLAQGRRHLRPAKSAESLSSGLNSDMLDIGEPMTRGIGSIENTLSPILLRSCEVKSNGHNRSVSHDSYFDQLQDQKENLDLSEIEVNFELEESEMRIFSEDETIMSNGSGSLASNGSPRILSYQKPVKGSSVKRLSYPKLTGDENEFDSAQNADPSPKKQKTNNEDSTRSKLEEQLRNSVGEIQFIDSVSPDQGLGQGDVHPIQSPSPVSSISQISSSLLVPSSPILPHIPHLMRPFSDVFHNRKGRLSTPDTLDCNRTFLSKVEKNDEELMSSISVSVSNRPHSTALSESTSYSHLMSPTQAESNAMSDKESLQSSELTTPETPLCSTYTPLVDFDESSLSNNTTPDVDDVMNMKKSSSDNLDKTILQSSLDSDSCKTIGDEVTELDEKILFENGSVAMPEKPHHEVITPDMVKLEKLKENSNHPKPEERKPKPVHPYANIPFVHTEIVPGKILETCFDGEPVTFNRTPDYGAKYESILNEILCDSFLNATEDEEENQPNRKSLPLESDFPLSEHYSPKSWEGIGAEKAIEPDLDTSQLLIEENNFLKEKGLEDSQEEMISSLWNVTEKDGKVTSDSESFESECVETNKVLSSCESNVNSTVCGYKAESNTKTSLDTGTENSECKENICQSEILVIPKTNENEEVTTLAILEREVSPETFNLDIVKESNELEAESISSERNEKTEEVFEQDLEQCDILLNNREPSQGLLETDLDAPEEVFEFGSNGFTGNDRKEAQIVGKVMMPTEESSSNEINRLLLTKSEVGLPSEINFSEEGYVETEKKSNGEIESISGSGDNANRFNLKESLEERPKTLERLSTRRKTEKGFTEPGISTGKILLGKSKSGSHINEKSPDIEKVDILLSCDFDLSDPQRRERIEKYKEKRRNYLREKYRSDSFKNEKDDFVLKIKLRHLRGKGSNWVEKGGGDEEAVGGRLPDAATTERWSPEKRERASGSGPRSWKALNPTPKEASTRRSFSAEVCGRSKCDCPAASTLLRDDSSQKSLFIGGERRSLSELKSGRRGSLEKKSNLSNFLLGGSVREEGNQAPSSSSSNSPRRFGESTKSSESTSAGEDEASAHSRKVNRMTGADRKSPVLCIKDMAAMFEGRTDQKTAKQYLSSV